MSRRDFNKAKLNNKLNSKHGLKSTSLKLIASMALFAILCTIADNANAQKVMTKKEYETILDGAVESQDAI